MLLLDVEYWYPRFRFPEKLDMLKGFVKRNLEHKLIDMDVKELVAVLSQEAGVLNDMFPNSQKYAVLLSEYSEKDKTAEVRVLRTERGVMAMKMRFRILDMNEDVVTSLEVEYSDSLSTT